MKPAKTSQMYKFELLMNTMTFKILKVTLKTLSHSTEVKNNFKIFGERAKQCHQYLLTRGKR